MWRHSLQFYSPCIHGSKTDMSLEQLLLKWEEIRRGRSFSCSGQAVLEEKCGPIGSIKMTPLTFNWPRHGAVNFHILVINSHFSPSKMTVNCRGIVGCYKAESITWYKEWLWLNTSLRLFWSSSSLFLKFVKFGENIWEEENVCHHQASWLLLIPTQHLVRMFMLPIF